jgi:hypothetical protein
VPCQGHILATNSITQQPSSTLRNETAFVHSVARHARTFLGLPTSSVLGENEMQFILSLCNELVSEIPPAAITPTVLTKPAPLTTLGAFTQTTLSEVFTPTTLSDVAQTFTTLITIPQIVHTKPAPPTTPGAFTQTTLSEVFALTALSDVA